ncbi:hypothetical protein OF83DRAFT_1153394, partial [Amylostereum chailletii]
MQERLFSSACPGLSSRGARRLRRLRRRLPVPRVHGGHSPAHASGCEEHVGDVHDPCSTPTERRRTSASPPPWKPSSRCSRRTSLHSSRGCSRPTSRPTRLRCASRRP